MGKRIINRPPSSFRRCYLLNNIRDPVNEIRISCVGPFQRNRDSQIRIVLLVEYLVKKDLAIEGQDSEYEEFLRIGEIISI